MKRNADIRRESLARVRQGKWFFRLFSVMLFFGVIQQLAGVLLDKAYGRFGLQTWMDFAQAKAAAMKGGLDYAVPSKAVMSQMNEATLFWLFITLVFAGIGYLGLATVNLKAAKDDAASWFGEAVGALARPFGCGWLAFTVAVRIFLWSLLLIVPGIVASYRYSQVWNVKAEHPDWSASRCIAESARLMDGRKLQRFRLDLFFFGWAVLAVAALAVVLPFVPRVVAAPVVLLAMGAMLFTALWMSVARAVFYRAALDAAGDGEPAAAAPEVRQ